MLLYRLILLLGCAVIYALPALAGGSAFSGNKIDDLFTVKSITGKSALTEGKASGLKEGDTVYFARSPYKFTVTAVKGNQVTVALPDGHDVEVGNTMMRNETDTVKKALNTENRLKQALEE